MFQNPVMSKDILRLAEGVRQELDPSFLLVHYKRQKEQPGASRNAGQVSRERFLGVHFWRISSQSLSNNSIYKRVADIVRENIGLFEIFILSTQNSFPFCLFQWAHGSSLLLYSELFT